MNGGVHDGNGQVPAGGAARLQDILTVAFHRLGAGGSEIIDRLCEAHVGVWGPLYYVFFFWNDVTGERKAGLFCEMPPGNRNLRPRLHPDRMTIELSSDCPSHLVNIKDVFRRSPAAKPTNEAAFVVAVSNTVGNFSTNRLLSSCEISIGGLRNVKATPERVGTIIYDRESSHQFNSNRTDLIAFAN